MGQGSVGTTCSTTIWCSSVPNSVFPASQSSSRAVAALPSTGRRIFMAGLRRSVVAEAMRRPLALHGEVQDGLPMATRRDEDDQSLHDAFMDADDLVAPG